MGPVPEAAGCGGCGAMLAPDARFCADCGRAVAAPPPAPSDITPTSPRTTPPTAGPTGFFSTPREKADGALVLGLCSLLCAWFTGVPAVLLGRKVLRELPATPEHAPVRRKAAIGVWCSVAAMAMWLPCGLLFALVDQGLVGERNPPDADEAGSAGPEDPAVATWKARLRDDCPPAVAAGQRIRKVVAALDAVEAEFPDPPSEPVPLAALREDLEPLEMGRVWHSLCNVGFEVRRARGRLAPTGDGKAQQPDPFDTVAAELDKVPVLLARLAPGQEPERVGLAGMRDALAKCGVTGRTVRAATAPVVARCAALRGQLQDFVFRKRTSAEDPALAKRYFEVESLVVNTYPHAGTLADLRAWGEKLRAAASATGDAEVIARCQASDEAFGPILQDVAKHEAERATAIRAVLGWVSEVVAVVPALRQEWKDAWGVLDPAWTRVLATCQEMVKEPERRRPPHEGLTRVSGKTYRVAGNEFYLTSGSKSRIVVIPAKYRDVYVQQRSDDPSEQHVSGYFLPSGEQQGINRLGGVVTAQVFTVDDEHAQAERRYTRWLKRYGPLFAHAERCASWEIAGVMRDPQFLGHLDALLTACR